MTTTPAGIVPGMRRPFVAFWRKAYEDNVTGMAAMVAYNLLLSVFPLALVALFVAGRILASEDVEASVVEDLQRLFPDAAESTLLDGLRRVRESSTTVGIVELVLGRPRHGLLPHLPP